MKIKDMFNLKEKAKNIGEIDITSEDVKGAAKTAGKITLKSAAVTTGYVTAFVGATIATGGTAPIVAVATGLVAGSGTYLAVRKNKNKETE